MGRRSRSLERKDVVDDARKTTLMRGASREWPSGYLALREIWPPLSREQLHAALRGVGVKWSALTESLRQAPAICLCSAVDETGEPWMLLARASVFEATMSKARALNPDQVALRVNWWVDATELPEDGFFLLARRADFERNETCQNGHVFGVALELLPYRCRMCGAPAKPSRPLSEPPRSGRFGERNPVGVHRAG